MTGEPDDAAHIAPPLRRHVPDSWDNPDTLWADVATDLEWFSPWETVYEETAVGSFRWFPGATTNLCYNCLDRHVAAGDGDRVALVYETGERDTSDQLTYEELLTRVKAAAAMLRGLGVEAGDPVTIYMPTSLEAAVAMLACTRIGALHAVVSTGLGTDALTHRIEAMEASVLLTADTGYRNGKTVHVEERVQHCLSAHPDRTASVGHVVSVSRCDTGRRECGDGGSTVESGPDWPAQLEHVRWQEAFDRGDVGEGEVADIDATDPAFVMHTSGSTGRPKGTVHTHGGYQVFLYAVMRWLFDAGPSEVLFVPADLGWAVTHGYGLYGALLTGSTSLLFEGVPTHPDAGVWWRLVEEYGVTRLLTAPSAIRTLRSADPAYERYALDSLDAVFSGGESLTEPAQHWLQTDVLDDSVPVVDYYGQTETGGAVLGNPLGLHRLSTKPGSVTVPLPGVEIDVVDESGDPVGTGEEGLLVIERPFPGLTPTLWEGHDRYVDAYWTVVPGVYWTGDAAVRDEDGYVTITGRHDDVITTSGHRIGPAEVESAALDHPAITQAAAVGVPDEARTEVIVLVVVLRSDETVTDDLRATLAERIRERVGPIAVVEDVVAVDSLPRTQTGKLRRRQVREILLRDNHDDQSYS